jgi:Uncharacterized protein conserved in bacteria (DUF2087)
VCSHDSIEIPLHDLDNTTGSSNGSSNQSKDRNNGTRVKHVIQSLLYELIDNSQIYQIQPVLSRQYFWYEILHLIYDDYDDTNPPSHADISNYEQHHRYHLSYLLHHIPETYRVWDYLQILDQNDDDSNINHNETGVDNNDTNRCSTKNNKVPYDDDIDSLVEAISILQNPNIIRVNPIYQKHGWISNGENGPDDHSADNTPRVVALPISKKHRSHYYFWICYILSLDLFPEPNVHIDQMTFNQRLFQQFSSIAVTSTEENDSTTTIRTTTTDIISIRRELIEYSFITRYDDGSYYWRPSYPIRFIYDEIERQKCNLDKKKDQGTNRNRNQPSASSSSLPTKNKGTYQDKNRRKVI